MKYAMVYNGIVVNVIVWDGITEYTPPVGHDLTPHASGCVIGGTWDGQEFGPVPPPPAPEPTP